MNVLLIGSGGREHALAIKIAESKLLDKFFVSTGNPGTETLAINIKLDIDDHLSILNFCKQEKIDLVVVGPEIPLVNGIADSLKENGIKVFGPSAAAARIEGEKSFAKQLMSSYKIPTAEYRIFSEKEIKEAIGYLQNYTFPCVIKADGLAAGKGVLICNNYKEAETAVTEIFESKAFGSAGKKLIIEEFMEGEEASLFAITDGQDFVCLPAAQDHKRIGDNDSGKNTGGMGAYAPASLITDKILQEVKDKIITPTLKALKLEGSTFCGCLYCGLMITDRGPKVVEFNCRFGDPETQVVLPLLKGDFLELLYSAASGNIKKNSVEYNGDAAVCVVLASKGYPEAYTKGYEIFGLDKLDDDIIVYHSGTLRNDKRIFTNGGRVLGVTGIAHLNDLKKAKRKAYKAVSAISYENIYYRKDIAEKGISKNK